MIRVRDGEDLAAAARTVRDACTATGFPPNSCIVAVRVLAEVCRHAGAAARPLPVSLAVFNPVAAALERAGRSVGERVPGAVVGVVRGTGRIGGSPGDDTWDGHLVAVADLGPAGRFLADPSLGQMHRPDLGLRAEAGAWPVPADWPEAGGQVAGDLPDGGLLVYEPIADRSWRDAPGWRGGPGVRAAAAIAIARLRARERQEAT